jgi:hypothetical protein
MNSLNLNKYPPTNTISQPQLIEDTVSERICDQKNIQTNWARRQYMQSNGNSIKRYNAAIHQQNTTAQCLSNSDKTKNGTPYLFESTFSPQLNIQAMGKSDLKQNFLKKEQLQCRMVAPSITISKR